MTRNIYISGPISQDPNFKENFRQAEDYLRLLKNVVKSKPIKRIYNPAKIADSWFFKTFIQHKSEQEIWSWCMKKCMKKIKKYNAIYLLKGWENSRGATIEHEYALTHGFVILKQGA